MNNSPILKDKRAVVFGAGSSIGAAVARNFGAEGAEVFLAGRTESTLDAVAHQINDTGGRAHVAVVDALDDTAVGKYLDDVVEQAGGIDVEFNATGPRPAVYAAGAQAIDVSAEQFLAAQLVLTSQFITARCAARRHADHPIMDSHTRSRAAEDHGPMDGLSPEVGCLAGAAAAKG